MIRALFAVVLACSCGAPSPPDGGGGDAGTDLATSEDAGSPWPNARVSRSATAGAVDQCHSEADAAVYLGSYQVETSCGGGASAVVTIDDVWFEADVTRPPVIDTLVPEPYPALLGTVSLADGDAFWANAYFYAQCPEVECPGAPIGCFRVPPGGLAFDLLGPGGWLSCYAGVGRDAGESEQCIRFGHDGTIENAGCSVSAVEN